MIRDTDDEGDVVAAAQAGDRAATEELLRRHLPSVASLCRRLAGNASDADDATQEALIAIVRGLPKFDGRSRFSTWAYRVATNACLDELRRRRRRPEPVDAAAHDATGRSSAPDPAGATADRIDIDHALARLPEEFRAAVVLRDLCALDYAEIAEVLGIPIGTVRSRIARGRAALVPLLGAGNPDTTSDRPSRQP